MLISRKYSLISKMTLILANLWSWLRARRRRRGGLLKQLWSAYEKYGRLRTSRDIPRLWSRCHRMSRTFVSRSSCWSRGRLRMTGGRFIDSAWHHRFAPSSRWFLRYWRAKKWRPWKICNSFSLFSNFIWRGNISNWIRIGANMHWLPSRDSTASSH